MSTEDSFTETEDELMDEVPDALKDGIALLDWWKTKDPTKSYKRHYTETESFNRPEDESYGFFDSVKLPSSDDKEVPINGNVQEMFYDDPKASVSEDALVKLKVDPDEIAGLATGMMHEQVREFILKYFMRISDFRQPQPAESEDGGEVTGFGFSQVYYKRRNCRIAKFPKEEQDKIVDLREFEKGEDGKEPYEWVVLKNPIFGFGFDFKPFGSLFDSLIGVSGPEVKLPAEVFNYLVISKDFVVNEDLTGSRKKTSKKKSGDDEAIGRYGFGYAFVNDPEPSVYGYGPGQLQPAFEQMVWSVHESGKVSVRAAFVAREPKGILHLSVDPLAWGFQFTKALGGEVPGFLQPIKRAWDRMPLTNRTFDPVLPTVALLNFFTAGQAAKLGISKDRIIKEALFIHFLQHYQTIVGSLQTWRQIRDWTVKEAELPQWVVSGKSS